MYLMSQNLESNRIIVVEAQPSDSGNYRCVARNDYSEAFAAEVISVEGTLHLAIIVVDGF